MTPVLIDEKVCAYDDCFMAVEVYDVRWFHSSPGPHTCNVFYRCVLGHHWVETESESG